MYSGISKQSRTVAEKGLAVGGVAGCRSLRTSGEFCSPRSGDGQTFVHAQFLAAVDGFTALQAGQLEVENVLAGFVELISDLLELAGGGVVAAVDGQSLSATSSRVPGVALDGLAQIVAHGPFDAAIARGENLHVADIGDLQDAWPQVVAQVRRAGIASVAVFPLAPGSPPSGSLVLVSDGPRQWVDSEMSMVDVLAAMVGVYLTHRSTVHRFERLTGQLEEALVSRIVVEQAKGIIANDKGIGVDAAYQLIRRHARAHNATVHAVSEAVVSLALRF